MRLILHIGMGKTGSSSIQSALNNATEQLAAQRARYLGMWFDMIDPGFRGVANQPKFFRQSPEDLREAGARFAEVVRQQADETGTETFILSNEAISGAAGAMKPFIDVLRETMEVQAIGYVRRPESWLPSAYVQWGIRDKTDTGPVPSYGTKARTLVNWYNGLLGWAERMPELLEVRSYDAAEDVVQDFAAACGLALDSPPKRALERGDDTEIVLRALFNARFEETVLPQVFERMVLRGTRGPTDLETAVRRYLDYSETGEIVAENRALFERYNSAFGLDLVDTGAAPPPPPDPETLRRRMLDHVVELTLEQSRRISRLEQRLRKIETTLADD